MFVNSVTSLRPVRIILNLQALQSKYSKTFFKHYCIAHTGRPNLDKRPTQGDPGQATKLVYRLLAENVTPKTEQGFEDALQHLIKDIQKLPEYQHFPGVKKRLEQIILYNNPPHTQVCGILALAMSDFCHGLRTQGLLNSGALQDENHLQKTYKVAWCTELIGKALIIKDDIVDESTIRHGQPSWHAMQVPNTPSFVAGNDAVLLEHATLALIESTFDHHPAQQKLIQAFRQALAISNAGMSMELIMNLEFKTTGKIATMDDYCWMKRLQNGYLMAILPITSVAILNGVDLPIHVKNQLATVCMDLILYFSIQRDYMDSFQEVEHIGNDKTDIPNARITWLLITAFEKASQAQRKQIQENIGKSSDSNVAAVLEVFKQLEIPTLHNDFQENFYKETTTKIKNLPETLPREIFQNYLNIYKRALSH